MQANVLVADITALSLVVPTASAAEQAIELADDEDVLALKDDDRLVIRTAVLDLTADENPRPSQRQRTVGPLAVEAANSMTVRTAPLGFATIVSMLIDAKYDLSVHHAQVVKLQQALRTRGLDTTGLKAALLARLVSALESQGVGASGEAAAGAAAGAGAASASSAGGGRDGDEDASAAAGPKRNRRDGGAGI